MVLLSSSSVFAMDYYTKVLKKTTLGLAYIAALSGCKEAKEAFKGTDRAYQVTGFMSIDFPNGSQEKFVMMGDDGGFPVLYETVEGFQDFDYIRDPYEYGECTPEDKDQYQALEGKFDKGKCPKKKPKKHPKPKRKKHKR